MASVCIIRKVWNKCMESTATQASSPALCCAWPGLEKKARRRSRRIATHRGRRYLGMTRFDARSPQRRPREIIPKKRDSLEWSAKNTSLGLVGLFSPPWRLSLVLSLHERLISWNAQSHVKMAGGRLILSRLRIHFRPEWDDRIAFEAKKETPSFLRSFFPSIFGSLFAACYIANSFERFPIFPLKYSDVYLRGVELAVNQTRFSLWSPSVRLMRSLWPADAIRTH